MEVYVAPGTINTAADEETPLLLSKKDNEVEIKVYRRRWYILFLFSLFCFTQAALWNTFGPISSTCEQAFGWNDTTIALLENWGGVAMVLFAYFYFWLMQVYGMRIAVVSSAFWLLLGSVLRIITTDPTAATVLIHIGQFIINIAACMAMGANPSVSAIWFPPQERVTATAISSSMGYLGVAASYVLGPLIVEGGLPDSGNSSNLTSSNDYYFTNQTVSTTSAPDDPDDVESRILRENIMVYLVIECVWCGVLFFATLIYYPDTPPQPPSISATTQRDNYWSGIRSLFRNVPYMIIALAYGIPVGAFGLWTGMLNVILGPAGISEQEAGWLGFYLTVASCIGAVAVGRFADLFMRKIKLFIFGLFILATVSFAVFSFQMMGGVMNYYAALLYITAISAGTFLISATPLMCELACELAYPASEIAANGTLAFINSLFSILVVIPFAVPNIGTSWINWSMTASCLVCIPFIAVMRGHFSRLAIDQLAPPDYQTTVVNTYRPDTPRRSDTTSRVERGLSSVQSRLRSFSLSSSSQSTSNEENGDDDVFTFSGTHLPGMRSSYMVKDTRLPGGRVRRSVSVETKRDRRTLSNLFPPLVAVRDTASSDGDGDRDNS